MASLQVRDLPEDLYYKLQKEAKKKHRSLAQQAIVTLAQGLKSNCEHRDRRQKILAALQNKGGGDTNTSNLPDPVNLVREDRTR